MQDSRPDWAKKNLAVLRSSSLHIVLTVIVFCFYTSISAQTSFIEDAATWNLDIPGEKDGGHGWTDYDNDGDFDALVHTHENTAIGRTYLLRNDGGSFTEVSSLIAPEIKSRVIPRSAVWADFNNDGLADFVRNSFNAMEIYLQDPITGMFGDGVGGTAPQNFDASNVADGFNSEGVGIIDVDSDGFYDIVFDNDQFGIDILMNDGSGHFNHATAKVDSPNPPYDNTDQSTWPSGLAQDAATGDYGSATDFDNDGYVDFISRKQNQVDVFRNNGGSFENGVNIGDAHNDNKGSVNLADYDNDGDFDLFWTDNGLNQIFRNDAGVFIPLGAATGIPISFASPIDGMASGDVDNDGDIDIFLAGDTRGYLYINQLNDPLLGRNTGSALDFILAPQQFHVGADGEGCTFIDLDNDGDLDLYININLGPNQLYINQLSGTPSANYVMLDVMDERIVRGLPAGQKINAIGATIEIFDCDGNVISGIREVNGGTGHGTMDAPRIHFGLPDGANQDYVFKISYPYLDGERLQFNYVTNPTDHGAYHYVEAEPTALLAQSPIAENDELNTPSIPITFDPRVDNGYGPDTDPASAAIEVTLVTTPVHGTAVINADGTVTYTPNPGYVGLDFFDYEINNAPSCHFGGLTDYATVTIHVDADNDQDGIGDPKDLDDDNDGILDLDEGRCSGPIQYLASWSHNTAPYDAGNINVPAAVASLDDETFGSGLGAYYVATSVRLTAVDQLDLAAARADNDYLQYGITMQPGINAAYLSSFSYTKLPAPITSDHYGYDFAILASKGGAAPFVQVLNTATVSTTVPGGFTGVVESDISDNFYFLEPSEYYVFRVYFFNKTTDPTVEAVFDDFWIHADVCAGLLHNDTDTTPNHWDADSDNDSCTDVIEAGFPDDDGDGKLGGLVPPAVDDKGRVTSGGL